MIEMVNDLALVGLGFGLTVGVTAAFTGYMLNLGFKLLKNFTL